MASKHVYSLRRVQHLSNKGRSMPGETSETHGSAAMSWDGPDHLSKKTHPGSKMGSLRRFDVPNPHPAPRGKSEGMTIPIREMADLLDVIRARKAELNLSNEVLEELAGMPHHYLTKLIGPRPLRGLSHMTLGSLMAALALRLTVEIDPELEAQLRPRWAERKRRPAQKAAE